MLKDYRPLPWADGDEAWRPTPMTLKLADRLAADSAMENAGGDADDRLTCFTHQCEGATASLPPRTPTR
jgi:hypothetical protein